MLLYCGVGEDSWESLWLQGDPTSQSQRKSVLNIHWKDWCWSWNSNTLATWCKEWTHWKRPWCWEKLKTEKGTIEDETVGWHHWLDGHEFEQAPRVRDGWGSLVCYRPWGWKESDTTEQLNSAELMIRLLSIIFNCIKPFFIWNKKKHLITYLVQSLPIHFLGHGPIACFIVQKVIYPLGQRKKVIWLISTAIYSPNILYPFILLHNDLNIFVFLAF